MSPLGYSWSVKGVRSDRSASRYRYYVKTMHPLALRKMGVRVPVEEEPPTPRCTDTNFDFCPTSPVRESPDKWYSPVSP